MKMKNTTLIGALFFYLTLLVAPARATQLPGPLVDTKWLAANIDNVVILDVRKDLKSFEKRAKTAKAVNPCGVGGGKKKGPIKVEGHIPGAVLVPWKGVTTKRKIAGKEIKVLMPEKNKFERLMQKSGVNNDSAVVITSKGKVLPHTAIAARLYLTMKYFGFDNVALLNGGTAQWIKNKNKVEFGKSRAKRGNFKASAERKEMLASTDDVTDVSLGQSDKQLLDMRSTAEYLGLTASGKFVTPGVKGHVAGAKSFPIALFGNALGPATIYKKESFQKVSELLRMDINKPTIAMCNSGVMASLGWFVLHELNGADNVSLYDGSMHEWSHLGKPVASMKFE